ncbi:hypothetical protein HDU67_008602 [Dinochytrium kinnereticum]|nr:hypothetical protein HDU67_008602 [Dinochytrium kinnereticum]
MTIGSRVQGVQGVHVLVPCEALTPTLDFFMRELGFKVSTIFPADDPKIAVIFGHGISLRLEERPDACTKRALPELQLLCDLESLPSDASRVLTAPNGMQITLVEAEPQFEVQPIKLQKLIVSETTDGKDDWVVGRAGMQYKDLIPGRLDGACIASLIRIPTGGPVPDYAHFHLIRFQIIFCRAGWVKVVYEDQGEPFILNPGDAVLQAKGIRHQVLESSDNLEVVEISAPAVHATHADHSVTLPTGRHLPDRVYGDGQRFAHHIASEVSWDPLPSQPGFEVQSTTIEKASNGAVALRVVRAHPTGSNLCMNLRHEGEMLFVVVLEGSARLEGRGADGMIVRRDDSLVLPANQELSLIPSPTEFIELLEIRVPAAAAVTA